MAAIASRPAGIEIAAKVLTIALLVISNSPLYDLRQLWF
jgi:hypothetical protein